MKILILGFTKVKYMPYLNFYLENINLEKNEVHLVYWNRDLKSEEMPFEKDTVRCHEFLRFQQDDARAFTKIGSFLKYRRFALRNIKRIKPDLIIFLHSLPGVLIKSILTKKYSGRYIFDYRDSTFERFKPFQKAINKLVENSKCTFVSSDAFRRFLPATQSDKIFTSHNLLIDSLNYRSEKEENGALSEKIRIAFWGFIRNEEVNKEIIEKISKDKRFELHYYGREQAVALNLKQYASEIKSENVFFHGEYKPEDRYNFIKETDIIHNIYSDDNMLFAMPNKYYDGLTFYLPQICLQGSFMGETCEKNNVGKMVDPFAHDFTEKIYEYYSSIDKQNFKQSCDSALEKVLEEYNFGCEFLKNATS